jgi:hypothetical protein
MGFDMFVPVMMDGSEAERAGAYTIKNYGFVIYRKWTDFIVR